MRAALTARQVADRLGVELATVYAYASRGALTPHPDPSGRRSRYDPDEVEALARRSRPRSGRRRVGTVDVVIGTTVSEIGDGWIRYRDHDLLDLAERCTYEQVCRLLWTGDLAVEAPRPGAAEPAAPLGTASLDGGMAVAVAAAARTASAALPTGASISARLAVGAATASALIPSEPGAIDPGETGHVVIDALVASLPLVGQEAPAGSPVARRLWPRISSQRPTAARVRALEVALVLLAEHELATSTLAARVAASTRAGAAECVLAGLGTVAGPLHGRAAAEVQARLAAGTDLHGDGPPPGHGHVVHQSGDPRFAPLLAATLAIAGARRRPAVEALARPPRGAPRPNVDAALGALGWVADAPAGATEAVFAIARTAGWLAHAYEEADEPPLRFRGRTLYRGPRTGP